MEKSGSEGQRELGNKVEKTKRKEERRGEKSIDPRREKEIGNERQSERGQAATRNRVEKEKIYRRKNGQSERKESNQEISERIKKKSLSNRTLTLRPSPRLLILSQLKYRYQDKKESTSRQVDRWRTGEETPCARAAVPPVSVLPAHLVRVMSGGPALPVPPSPGRVRSTLISYSVSGSRCHNL
ncbi:hypothetical protein EYF80_058598 [Liparis tanakae]|uniref:Uncharacterized protein n=1 Tax=Liparis tanakae TaxID=230148 RepID=A0A4Z2ERL5_9TELE|nr:hypothetical protein EYF80_058598 [Liparis tanakae]